MVLIPKANRKKILMNLFSEGVLTCKKDGMKKEHDDVTGVPNLHVMMVMKSLTSKGYVSMKFNWQWFYYCLTDEGIQALREELHLPSSVSPQTLTKQTKNFDRSGAGDREERGKGKGKGKGFGKGKGGWGREKGEGKGEGKGYGKGYGKGKGGDYNSEEKPAENAEQ